MSIVSSFKGKYDFLSNFYPCRIKYQGITYPSVEHAFQACKTFNRTQRIEIAAFESPSAAKRAGRELKLRGDWEEVKESLMYHFLRLKFGEKRLQRKLLATRKMILIEGNTWNDCYWGYCDGEGDNRLGVLLMRVRSLYRCAS